MKQSVMKKDLCYRVNDHLEQLAQVFIDTYFWTDIETEGWFVEWGDDELRYNLYVNDYYFTISDVFTALWYNIPSEILWEWYDQWISEKGVNLKNFYKMNIGKW